IEKYKANPKTAYLAKTYESLNDEESRQMLLSEMERIFNAENEGENEEFPNEIILEIRAGAGGDEAALFAKELAEMYGLYGQKNGWSMTLISSSENSLGGYKE